MSSNQASKIALLRKPARAGLLALTTLAIAGSARAQTWFARSGMTTGRSSLAAAVAVHDGFNRIFVFGGMDGGGTQVYDSTEMYSLPTNSWVARAPMPAERVYLAAATANDSDGQKIFVFGGVEGGITSTSTTWSYDPVLDEWAVLAPMPAARANHSAATGPDGLIYVFGGSDNPSLLAAATVFAYDPVNDTWDTDIPAMPTGRDGHVSATGCDGLIYVAGGGTSTVPSTVLDVFDPLARSWPATNPTTATPWAPLLFSQAAKPGGAIGRDAKLYLIGGDGYPWETGVVQAYDPSANEWTEEQQQLTPRVSLAAVSMGSRVFALGGWKKFGDGAQNGNESYGQLPLKSECDGIIPTVPFGWQYCLALPNSTGASAFMAASGSGSVADDDFTIFTSPVPHQPGLFFFGPNQIAIPFGDGFRCVGGTLTRLEVVFPSGNVLSCPVPLGPNGITAGSTWNFQAWFRDPLAGGAGFNTSDGYEMFFTP